VIGDLANRGILASYVSRLNAMAYDSDRGCVDLNKNEEFRSLSLVDTVILDQCANGLPQFEMKSCFFSAATSKIQRNLMCIFLGCFKTK
jgi:hypothetical protein